MDAAVIPDASKVLFALLATWVLFFVFVASALAFVMVIFGLLKPDPTTKKYLFAMFSVSTVGVFTGVVTNNFVASPAFAIKKIGVAAIREQAQANSATLPTATVSSTGVTTPVTGRLTLFTQIGSTDDLARYEKLKSALPTAKYIVTPVDNVGVAIGRDEVRFCNPDNESAAKTLAQLLSDQHAGDFKTAKIQNCDQQRNRNILEIWLKTAT